MDPQFLTIIGLVLSSGAVIEIIKWLVSRPSKEREARSSDIELAMKIRDQVDETTKDQISELRQDISDLKDEVKTLRVEVRFWQEKHDQVVRENAHIQSQYLIVQSTLTNLISWLRQNKIEVPFQMPTLIDVSRFTRPDEPKVAN